MKRIFLLATIALVTLLAFASFKSSAKDPRPVGPSEEYLTIHYIGRHDSYALLPGGKTQFFPEFANLDVDRVDIRVLAIHTLINRFAKEGYEYVDSPEPNRVIMKRLKL